MKNAIWMFIGIEVKVHIMFGSMAIFTILIRQSRSMEDLSIIVSSMVSFIRCLKVLLQSLSPLRQCLFLEIFLLSYY